MVAAIDDNVMNILFLHQNNLYGISRDYQRVSSLDGGNTWCTIPDTDFEIAKAELHDVLHVTRLPFEDFNMYELPCNTTIKYKGLYLAFWVHTYIHKHTYTHMQ